MFKKIKYQEKSLPSKYHEKEQKQSKRIKQMHESASTQMPKPSKNEAKTPSFTKVKENK